MLTCLEPYFFLFLRGGGSVALDTEKTARQKSKNEDVQCSAVSAMRGCGAVRKC